MEENKQEVVVNTRKVIKISKKKVKIAIVIVIIIILLALAILAMSSSNNYGLLSFLTLFIPVLMALAAIYFIWGIIQLFLTETDIGRKSAKHKIGYSLIGGIVILVFWGISSLGSRMFISGPERLMESDIPCIPNASLGINCPDSQGISSRITNSLGSESSNIFKSMGSPAGGIAYDDSNSYNRYPQQQQPTISDTREFLKTGYSATIKTRNVSDVVKEVKNIVKGSDGRIDGSNSAEKYGYVRFVVPKSKFDTFRDEMESITNKKLYIESISEQNLLNQKQGIEKQTGNIVNTLANLQGQKTTLDSNHTQAINNINNEITRIKAELATIRTVLSTTTLEPQALLSFKNQETTLVAQLKTKDQALAKENTNYSIQSQNLANQINNSNNNLTNVNQQDSQFTDNIETVSGSVNVNWVSLWQMARIFSPIPPFWIIVILVILLGVLLTRNKHIPKVEFE